MLETELPLDEDEDEDEDEDDLLRLLLLIGPALLGVLKVDTLVRLMDRDRTMTKIKILYNDSYDGDFGFSEELEATYKARTGREMRTEVRLYRVGADSIRRDPVAIALVEEFGTERASAVGAYLQIREIPALFERYWSVESSFGTESIHVDVNEAYADVLHHYMDTGDSAVLVDQYRKVRAAAGQLARSDGDGAIGLTAADRTPVLKPGEAKAADERSSSSSDSDARIGHT